MKLGPVQDRPEDVGEGFRLVLVGLSPLDESHQQRQLVGSRPAGQGREVEGFDPARRVQERGLDDRAQDLAGLGIGGAVDVTTRSSSSAPG